MAFTGAEMRSHRDSKRQPFQEVLLGKGMEKLKLEEDWGLKVEFFFVFKRELLGYACK